MNDEHVKFKLTVPWGVFGLNGEWQPNPLLKMPEDEQRRQNVEHGYLKADEARCDYCAGQGETFYERPCSYCLGSGTVKKAQP